VLGPDSVVLLLQNGLGNEECASRVVDARRILGGVAFVCLNRTAPGEVRHTAFGYLKADCFSPGGDPESIERVRQAFLRAGVGFHRAESLPYLKWEKLVWNVPFNGLSASFGGVDTLSILEHAPSKRLAGELMQEVIDAARSQSIRLDPKLVSDNLEKTLSMGPYRTSMCLDRLARRPLEAESIVGEPLRRAERKGVSLPRMQALYAHLSFYNRTAGFVEKADSRVYPNQENDS
jgi:2-dehydropantoate 2-reductase